MSDYENRAEATKGKGNRYKVMSHPYSEKEAIHWVGGDLLNLDKILLRYLKKQGLTPDKSFLDIGCGPLRCSKLIIAYLNSNNYCGMEGDINLIKVARNSLTESLRHKNPTIKQSWDFEISLFNRTTFDFILSQGVICHMPNPEIKKLLSSTAPYLSSDGEAHISYIPGNRKNIDSGVFEQTFEELALMAKEIGFTAKNMGEWGHPRNLHMMKLKRV